MEGTAAWSHIPIHWGEGINKKLRKHMRRRANLEIDQIRQDDSATIQDMGFKLWSFRELDGAWRRMDAPC
jgi:hypothetical protein